MGLVVRPWFGLSIADMLIESEQLEKLPLEAAIVTTELEHQDLVPPKLRFARFEKEPAIAINRLWSKLAPLSATYDFAVIDTPPTLGQIRPERRELPRLGADEAREARVSARTLPA